jgi:autotransporter-associated beta strand protein
MKNNIHLIISLICIAFCGTSVRAAYYWDINGPTAGAGGSTPSGTWDVGVTQNWSTDSAGGVATIAWTNWNDAVFSAGSDATGAFSIGLSNTPMVGNLTVEDGAVTISGDTVLSVGGGNGGKGIINVFPNAALTINSTVKGWDDNQMLSLVGSNTANGTISGTIVNAGPSLTRLEKRQTGTWVLTGTNTYSGVTDIRDGTLVVGVLADAGLPSSIGTGSAGAWHAVIGLGEHGLTNATLKYTGTGHSTSRKFCLWGDTGAGTIDASGTGPLVLLGDIIHNPAMPEIADKLFTIKGSNMGTNTISGQISDGLGGFKTSVKKDGPGKWVLTGSQYYRGATTVNEGTLVWNASWSQTEAISINSGATLGGTGMIDAPLTTIAPGGTLSPGDSIGTLTLFGELSLAGNLFIEVDKSFSPSSDVISASGALNNVGTGTVTVRNLGPALAVGDTFVVIKDGSNNPRPLPNGQMMTVVSADGGVVWNNKLAVDGSIAVLSVSPPPVPATNLTIVAAGPASFNLGGLGAANRAYKVYASTNVTTPMANWWLIGTTNSSAGGVIQFLDLQATNKQRFYRFGQ